MEKSAENLLLRLYAKKKLAPFYIIRGPISSTHCPLLEWAQDFAATLLEKEKAIDKNSANEMIQLGHQDLLFISKTRDSEETDDQRPYKIDDPAMKEYFKSVQYGPIELEQKFIFINQGQLISEYFANKWLKTLEEPEENVTTLFLVETGSPLLDTIESRAITLRVQKDHPEQYYHVPEEHQDFSHFLKENIQRFDLTKACIEKVQLFCQAPQRPHILIEAIREHSALRMPLYRLMNDYMLATNHSLRAQQHWLEEIRWFQKAETFNNSATERFYGLLSCVIESTAHRILT